MIPRVTVTAVLMMLVALAVATTAALPQPEPAPPPLAEAQPAPAQSPPEAAPPAAAPAEPGPPAPTSPAQESLLLRLKFSPGEVMRYRIFADAQGVVRMNIPMPSQSPIPPELPVRVVIQGVGIAKVLRLDAAKAARLRVGGDDLTMTTQFMGQSFTMKVKGGKYSLTQNGKPVQAGKAPLMPKGTRIPFIQEPLEVKVGPRGEVLDIAIPSMGNLAALMPGMTMQQMLKDQILLPEEPLVVGQTWSADRTQNLPGTTTPVTYGIRMALEKIETWEGKRQVGALRIESVTTVRDMDLSKFAGAQMPQGQPSVAGTMSMEQQLGGNMLFDATRGLMMRFDFQASQEMSMHSSVTVPQKGTQNMSMDMQFTVKGAIAKI
jgi:hypothetical protein